MKKYKRIWSGRGIKSIDSCPRCNEPGYLTAHWCARENTMTWCGPYFSIQHYDLDPITGFLINGINHYVGIEFRDDFPELGKEPPSIEWIEEYRLRKGFSSLPKFKERSRRQLQNLRQNIRDELMGLPKNKLIEVLSVLKNGGQTE